MILQTFLQLSLTSRALKYLDLSHFKTNFQTLWPLSKVDLEQCFIRLAPFSKEKKKDLSVPRTNVKMMVMLREKRVSFPITFVAKIGFANRPTTIISIALAAQKWWLHHHHHHLLKYYRENEWPSFIFFCAHLPRKMYQGKDLFFSLVYFKICFTSLQFISVKYWFYTYVLILWSEMGTLSM